MVGEVLSVPRRLGGAIQSRRHLVLENLALRRQLGVLNRSAEKRRFNNSDRLLWMCLRAVWSPLALAIERGLADA